MIEKIREYLKEKGIGFYVLAIAAVFTVVSAIVYAVSYASSGEGNLKMMNIWVIVFLIIGTIGGAALSLFKKTCFWAPFVTAACVFVAFLFFVVTVYPYVSVVMVGIDISSFSSGFLASTILLVIALITSVAAVFFKQRKDSVA